MKKKSIALLLMCILFLAILPVCAQKYIVVTFGGDCTLGSEDQLWDRENSFISVVNAQGFEYPFKNLVDLFSKDDLTIVNLEGTFHDSKNGKLKKAFNFRAPSDFAKILPLSKIEAVTLGNNHIFDYGEKGFSSTIKALDAVGTAWFANCRYENRGYLYEKDGVKIGFVGFYIGDWRKQPSLIRDTIDELKLQGANALVGIMHGGAEYSSFHDSNQEKMAEWLILNGVSLVIGHHPHVVQGVAVNADSSIVYSLGNLSFGGNSRIRKQAGDALLAQVKFSFDDSSNYIGHQVRLIPIHPSSTGDKTNNFQPALADLLNAQRILAGVQKDTDFILPPYEENIGCTLPFVPVAVD
ncbi:MAG: CapA family protein [Eubacteriales bacterium]|nr:CapA family protein [Eubacteriales bacterium]